MECCRLRQTKITIVAAKTAMTQRTAPTTPPMIPIKFVVVTSAERLEIIITYFRMWFV